MTSRLPSTPAASGRRKSGIPGIGTPGPVQTPTRTPMRRSSLAPPPLPSSEPRVGSSVEFELAGEPMTGTLRFIGGVEGKAGTWAGVELDDEFAGRGKNDGSVQGTQYFACPPQCGLFLPVAKVRPVRRNPPLKVSDLMPAPASTTRTPRRSLSPTKQPSLSASTPRMPRPSAAHAGMPTPTPRRSLGPSTPRLSARPPSRQEVPPQVPPIPLAYGLARSVTPSSATGRMTPARRRTSLATTTASDLPPRSTTPSLRSSSRQSFASSISRQSVSRQSHRADERSFSRQSHRGGDDDTPRRNDENELELKQLLDASERLGREMEDRLVEKSRRIKQLEADLAQRLETPAEPPAPVADSTQADRIATLEAELTAQLEASQKLKLEAKHKSAAMEAQVESLRERLDAASQEHTRERDQLRSEVDKLRTAGQALCETYEEKIAEIELARLEAVDLVESLQGQLQARPKSATPDLAPTTTPTTAATIDAETARAQVEHLRSKVALLEDQLEQVRHQLEQEVGDARERRARHQEVEAALKEQIRSLKETVDSSNKAEKRAHARIKELQAALAESQSTLEAERSELEGLRQDDSTTSALADDLQRAQCDLATSKSELERAERESHQLGELVTRLRQDLRHAEAEIQCLAQQPQGQSSSAQNEVNELRIIVDSLTAENKELHDRRGTDPTTNQEADLRKQLEDVQRKSALEIKALKEEISELESLVESQIYNNNDDKPANGSADSAPRKCEMCGEAGHDLTACPDLTPTDDLVASTSPPLSMPMNGRTDSQEWCDDCEEFGHALENCPLANEIF